MKVLVTYASKRGSTAEIANAVGGVLREDELDVNCVAVDDVAELDDYDAVVIGSAVYMGRWRGDAKHFLRKHREELAHMPFWVFSSGPTGDPDKGPANPKWIEPPKIIAQAERAGVRGHTVFGGCMPVEPHGRLERTMIANTPEEFRDRRDWDEIRSWANAIAAELVPVR